MVAGVGLAAWPAGWLEGKPLAGRGCLSVCLPACLLTCVCMHDAMRPESQQQEHQ